MMRPTSARGSVTTRLGDALDPNTPSGLCEAFRNVALECREGARILHERSPDFDTTDRYILTAHALELCLKAFLAKHGLTKKQLQKPPYGHNLDHLYSEAVARGLSLSIVEVRGKVAWLNEYHDRGALLRYDATTTRTLPKCAVYFEVIDAILLALERLRG